MNICYKTVFFLPLAFLSGKSFAADSMPAASAPAAAAADAPAAAPMATIKVIAPPSAAAATPPADSPIDFSHFTFRLNLTGRYSFADSTRKEANDLWGQTGRFGLNYAYKNVTGTFEAQAGDTANAPTATVTPPSNQADTKGGENYFAIRRANLGLMLYNTDPLTLTFFIGRDRLSGSAVYAPDATKNNTSTNIANQSSYANEDGISVQYKGKYNFGTTTASVGYYKNIGVTVKASGANPITQLSVSQADSKFGAQTLTDSRAYAIALASDINSGSDAKIEARAFYANQAYAPISEVPVASPGPTPFQARDLQDIEASLGYNYKAGLVKGGVWYQNAILGRTQVSTAYTTNDINYVNGAADDSQNIRTLGAGFNVNSKVFGVTGLLFDGDNLTFAGSIEDVSGQLIAGNSPTGALCNAGATGGSTAACHLTAIDQVNLGVGYQQEAYTLELNYFYTQANANIYAGNSANESGAVNINQSSANILYLCGTINF